MEVESQHTKVPHGVFGLAYDLAEVKIYGCSWSKFFLEAYDRIRIFLRKQTLPENIFATECPF